MCHVSTQSKIYFKRTDIISKLLQKIVPMIVFPENSQIEEINIHKSEVNSMLVYLKD